MNFLILDRGEEALVEARRALKLLDEKDRPDSLQDPFTRYLAAIAFDIRGADDDAYIEFKKVAKLAPAFPYAKAPLLRLARKTNRAEDLARWKALPGPETDFAPDHGVLVAFVQVGRSPVKKERATVLPPAHRFVVPDYAPRPCDTGAAVLCVDERQARSFPLTDVQEAAIRGLQDRMAKEVAKETARLALAEGTAQVIRHNVEGEKGNALAWLWRIFYAAARTTDTRSWQTLPRSLQAACLPLPVGTRQARFSFLPASTAVNLTPQDTTRWNYGHTVPPPPRFPGSPRRWQRRSDRGPPPLLACGGF